MPRAMHGAVSGPAAVRAAVVSGCPTVLPAAREVCKDRGRETCVSGMQLFRQWRGGVGSSRHVLRERRMHALLET